MKLSSERGCMHAYVYTSGGSQKIPFYTQALGIVWEYLDVVVDGQEVIGFWPSSGFLEGNHPSSSRISFLH